jgi:hypothetical protein
LFRSSFKETLTGIVDIAGIPYQMFVDVVHYMYTGIIPQSYCSAAGFESLCSMCELANRYESVNLLRYCERLIIGRLNVCNSMSLYVWSKTFNLPSLRRASMAFMGDNWEDMCRMPEMVTFDRDNHEMYFKVNAKIFRHIAGGERLALVRGTPFFMHTSLHGVS